MIPTVNDRSLRKAINELAAWNLELRREIYFYYHKSIKSTNNISFTDRLHCEEYGDDESDGECDGDDDEG